jgi:altronate hydrolase
VGTRNYIGVLPTVNCSATVARYIADAFRGEALTDFPNVDGVVALCHGTGCGMAGSGEGFEILQRTIGGYARHPNFASVLLVGLGCEVNEIESLLENMHLETGPLLQTMTIQKQGGTSKTVREGVTCIRRMLREANRVERSPVPLSRLVLGLECGGSDAYSGITANPALGAAVDILVRHGGTAVLSETPEIYGAEHLLTRRAVNLAVGERLVQRIRWWEEYTARNGGEMDNNPSPGNKAGGLTTILEKSLGAVAKGGTTTLMDVYRYAEPVTSNGLVFMDTPGYDSVSVTGMVAGGVNIVCFTTGRGSVFGCKPVPSLKLATNTAMYSLMTDDMDVNCGIILDGEATIEEMGERIFHLILETASGKKTKSEWLGFGDNEFTPWQIGSVM